MFVLSGMFVGGVYSLVKQGSSKVMIAIVAAAALVALVAAVLWLSPGDT